MPELLDETGLTDEVLIEKYILPKLQAKETKVFQHNGEIKYSKEVDAHDIQLRTFDMVLRLKGAYPSSDPALAAQVGVRVIVVPKELPPDREEFYNQQQEEKIE